MTEQYSTDPKYKDFNNYIMSRVPAKRWGDPMDLAGAVIFLSSAASDYITGSKSPLSRAREEVMNRD